MNEQPISARKKQYPPVWYISMFDNDLRCLVRLAVMFGNSSTRRFIHLDCESAAAVEFFNEYTIGGLNYFANVGTTLKPATLLK